MVSGSAALPQPIREEWEGLTGHELLGRYGMTETGMVVTEALHGNRVPGEILSNFVCYDFTQKVISILQ